VTYAAILNRITRFYLGSKNFNGMPVRSLADRLEINLDELVPLIAPLVEREQVGIVYGDRHPNPHIRALPDEPVPSQLSKLRTDKLEQACVYPLRPYLEQVVNKDYFIEYPYALELALGSPQYTFVYFDPTVLDHYVRQDLCTHLSDVEGILTFADAEVHFSRAVLGKKYSPPCTELIAMNLGHLSKLSATDQQFWHIMAFPCDGSIHPDVNGPLMEGALRERISIFDALVGEMEAINSLLVHFGKPELFLFKAAHERKLKHYGFLPTPSYDHFQQFFLNFQILMFQNVNPAFLTSIGILDRSVVNRPGTRSRRPARTVLEFTNEWLKDNFPLHTEGPLQRLVEFVKQTRRDLQQSSNFLHTSHFDRTLLHLQRRLMWHAYHAVKSIRLTLEHYSGILLEELHPLVREEKVWVV